MKYFHIALLAFLTTAVSLCFLPPYQNVSAQEVQEQQQEEDPEVQEQQQEENIELQDKEVESEEYKEE